MKESEAKLKSAIKDEVNERLREYLKANSQFISGSVERHIKTVDKGRLPDIETKISNLGLLAFERQ
jgi:LPS O-antigen subunit length determinant protein (WzzB/FepE family)